MKKVKVADFPLDFPPKYYFVQSSEEGGGRIRLHLLPYQYLPNPTAPSELLELKTSNNVQADKANRSRYDVGQIFAVQQLKEQLSFYQADKSFLFPVDDSAYGTHDVRREVQEEFGKYKTFADKMAGGASFSDPSVKPKKTYLSRLQAKSSLAVPTIEDDGYYIEEEKWWYLVRNFKKQIPTLLLGPTGTAKTTAVFILAKRMGIDLNVHDMGAMQDPIAGMLGVHRLEAGESVFDEAKFVTDVQTPGIVLLDELSRAPSSANNILFPCLDFRKNLPIALASSHQAREVKVNEKTCFMATANIGSEYVGTQELDAALKSRFEMLEFNYLPAAIETKLLKKVCGIAETEANYIATLADTLRNTHTTSELSSTVSTRDTLAIGNLVNDGFDKKAACRLVLLPLYEGVEGQEGERTTVAEMIKNAY